MKIRAAHYLRDKDFRFDQSEDCELLIKVSPKRFSFAILDRLDNKVHALYHSELLQSADEIIEEVNTDSHYFNQTFKNVKIASETFNFTFIPDSFFNSDDLEVYQNLVPQQLNSQLSVSSIKAAGVKSIFRSSERLNATLLNKFPNALLFNQADALITGALFAYGGSRKLFIQVNDHNFEAALIEEGKLLFYNIFEIQNADDFNYYLLLLIRQLQLNRSLPVLISGNVDQHQDIYKRTGKYFNETSLADSTRIAGYAGDLRELPSHEFFALLSLAVCG